MKFANLLSTLTVITFAVVINTAQATDLVKAEPVQKVTVTNELKLNLEQSLKAMQLTVKPSINLVQKATINHQGLLVKKSDGKLAKATIVAE